MALDSLRRWWNLAGTIPCCLGGPSNFEKKSTRSGNRHGKNIRLYLEGNLYNAYVRTGNAQELAPVEPAEVSWTMMEVDDGQRDKQEECEDQLEELRRVLEARQPTELERQKFPNESCCVRNLVRGVCESERNRSTAQETDEQGIGEARTTWTQNPLRFLVHERGRSFDANACIAIQQIREDGSHSIGTERIDAVRSENLCRLQQTGVRTFINKSDGEPARH